MIEILILKASQALDLISQTSKESLKKTHRAHLKKIFHWEKIYLWKKNKYSLIQAW